MSTIADLLIKLGVDSSVDKDLAGVGAKVKRGVDKAFLPAVATLGGLAIVGKQAFDNLQDGAKNAAQTEAVIKSTGGAAHVTASHVDELAMSLRRKAGVDDDVVHVGENMLLTFTNIRNEVGKGNAIFDQATATALDMSVALGQDIKSSALQLGKALNDPVRGMTALQRVGVSFTEAQKDQVKAMVKTGDTLGAQKLILHELGKEFGGAATHIDPLQKSMANLKLDAVDLASGLLTGLMPAFQSLVGILGAATGFMTKHQTATKILVGGVAALAAGVVVLNTVIKLWSALQLVAKAATVAWTAAQWLLNAALTANPIGIVIVALAALGVALVALWTKSETFRKIVTAAWTAIKNTTVTVWNFLVGFFKRWWPLILGIMTGGIGLVIALIITKWGAIKAATTAAWDAVKSVVMGAVNAVKGAVTGGFNAAAGAVSGAVNRIRGVVSSVFGALGGLVNKAIGPVKAGVDGIVGAFGGIISILDRIIGLAGSAVSAIDRVADAAGKVGSVAGKIGGALGHIPGFASGVRDFAGGLAVVGENGPELVNLPRGADVFSNRESANMLGGKGLTVNGDLVVREELDIERIGALITRRLSVVN